MTDSWFLLLAGLFFSLTTVCIGLHFYPTAGPIFSGITAWSMMIGFGLRGIKQDRAAKVKSDGN